MNKSIKTLSILILMLLSAILLSTGMFMTVSFAQNNTSNTSVTMSGVSLRTFTDEKGKYGLKFKGVISNHDSNLTYGMDIVPADLKDDSSKYAELTAEPKVEDGVYYYECALTDIFASNRSRPFTARPFVKDSAGTNKEYVGDWAEAKSIYTIATQALADQSYDYDTNIRTYLEEIIATVHGTGTDNINGRYILKTLTIDGEDVTSFDKKFTGNVNFNTTITMVKEGDASKTITAYPVITMKNKAGADITSLLSQVDTRGNYKLATSSLSDFQLSFSLAGEEIASIDGCDITANKATYSQDRTISLNGQQVGAYLSSAYCDSYDSAYVAVEGEYGVGTYIDVEFTGNNMPYVCFFADEINGNLGANGGQGVIFFNGVMNNSSDVDSSTGLPKESAYWRGGQLIAYGPNRMKSTNYAHNGDMNWFAKGYESGNILDAGIYRATQMGLRENPNTKYKMTIGTYDADGILGIDFKLVEVETGATICQVKQPTRAGYTISTSDIEPGNIIFYANFKDSSSSVNRFTTFKYSQPYEPQIEYSLGTTINTDGSVTLQAGDHPGVTGTTDGSCSGTGYVSGVSKVKSSYIAFKNTAKVGNYIDFTFTGNNMPQVVLFTDKINNSIGSSIDGVNDTKDNTGYIITNGIFNSINSETYLGGFSGKYQISVSGPNRIDANIGDLTSATVVQGSYAGLSDNVNYKYTVGSQVEDGKVVIVIELYNADTNTLLYQGTYNTGKTETEIEAIGSHIIAYAGIKGPNVSTTFKYSEVYAKNEK